MPVFYHRNFCANIIFLNQVNNKMRLNKTPEPLQTEAAVSRRKEFKNPVKSHFYSNRLLRAICPKRRFRIPIGQKTRSVPFNGVRHSRLSFGQKNDMVRICLELFLVSSRDGTLYARN